MVTALRAIGLFGVVTAPALLLTAAPYLGLVDKNNAQFWALAGLAWFVVSLVIVVVFRTQGSRDTWMPRMPLAHGDGSNFAFRTTSPYQRGTLHVTVDGIVQHAVEDDPATGSFALTFAPAQSETVEASWKVGPGKGAQLGNPVWSAIQRIGPALARIKSRIPRITIHVSWPAERRRSQSAIRTVEAERDDLAAQLAAERAKHPVVTPDPAVMELKTFAPTVSVEPPEPVLRRRIAELEKELADERKTPRLPSPPSVRVTGGMTWIEPWAYRLGVAKLLRKLYFATHQEDIASLDKDAIASVHAPKDWADPIYQEIGLPREPSYDPEHVLARKEEHERENAAQAARRGATEPPLGQAGSAGPASE
jgi:hypothetical protein